MSDIKLTDNTKMSKEQYTLMKRSAEHDNIENLFMGGTSIDDVMRVYPHWEKQDIENALFELERFYL